MDTSLETILNDCIDALAAGEPVDQILARYPQEAATLRPLLLTAASLFDLSANPAPEARTASRRAFLQQAAASRSRPAFWQRFALIAASILVFLVFAGGGLVWAANASLPGDPLYGIKRSVERVQLTLSGNSEQLEIRFAERRRSEVMALIQRRREAEVEFSGVLKEVTPNRWSVGDIPVIIDSVTQIRGQPLPGANVVVFGYTTASAHAVQATVIIIERNGNSNGNDSRNEPQAEPAATQTAMPSPAATSTARPSPLATATSLPTLTPTNNPTATLAPPPTATPTLPSRPTIDPSPRPRDDDDRRDRTATPSPKPNDDDDNRRDETVTPSPKPDDDDNRRDETVTPSPKPDDDDDRRDETTTPSPKPDDDNSGRGSDNSGGGGDDDDDDDDDD